MDQNELRDGTDKKLSGVFSSSNTVLAANQRARIPGALDAGSDVGTKTYLECFLIFCTQRPSRHRAGLPHRPDRECRGAARRAVLVRVAARAEPEVDRQLRLRLRGERPGEFVAIRA